MARFKFAADNTHLWGIQLSEFHQAPKKVFRIVITNVKPEHEKDVMAALVQLIQRGIIQISDVHFREEKVEA